MFTNRVTHELLIDQLSAESYDPILLKNISKVARGKRLGEFLLRDPKLGVTGTIASSYVSCDTPGAVPYLTTKQVAGLFAYPKSCKYITAEADQLWAKCRVKHGAILINKSGDVGAAALLSAPEYSHVSSVSDLINVSVRNGTDGIDPAFLVVYLNSPYAQDQLKRFSGGAIFNHVSIYAIPEVRLYCPAPLTQTFIGDKVRQAERLQVRASNFQSRIDHILTQGPIEKAMMTSDDRTNRVKPEQLEVRLDAKFYSPRSMRIFESVFDCDGVPISDLKPVVSNGFEYRTFVARGKVLATVSQVSAKRLDLSGAPQIPEATPVPLRARLTPHTVLAVRSGATIGTVVKSHAEDCHACACGDFVVFHFPNESLAAAVAAFLNSEPGRILQDKVIYGGVIPKICQDDLLTLPIPKAILDAGGKIACWMNEIEQALRCSQRLVTSAKLLVESLIEGRLSECDLVNAQHALQRGDRTLDIAILSRLTEDGIDMADKPPLFPNLDALYSVIDEMQQTQPSNGDAA